MNRPTAPTSDKPTSDKKVFVGPRLKRLRKRLGLTQARMAEELGISTSYLNLIERDQRPLSVQILLKLADLYDFELSTLAGDGEARAVAELAEVFSDPLFKSAPVERWELQELAAQAPSTVEAIMLLYRTYRDTTLRMSSLHERLADRDKAELLAGASQPIEEVREFIHNSKNYFPAIDEAAEALSDELGVGSAHAFAALQKRLRERHGVAVQIMPVDVMSQSLRYYDRHRRRIMLSELLEQSARDFQLAHQLGILEYGARFDETVKDAGLTNPESMRLCRVNLANYFAAALLMPYQKFLGAAESLAYDIELLGHRFGTSFEQACHRLTTLQRPGARGIPFFFIRIDNAGNVSKRFSAGRFHFSKFGGTCPLWNIHDTFQTPGKIYTQIVRLPDEATYFSVARTVTRAGGHYSQPGQQLAIGLGCDLSYARRLVYARGYDLEAPEATPIGINCHLCERPHCAQRAFPPLNRQIVIDERARGVSLFSFDAS